MMKWIFVLYFLWASLGTVVISADQDSTLLRGNATTSVDVSASIIHSNCDESFPCLLGGQKMHWRGWHNKCHTACIPTIFGGLKLKFHWECGPCIPDAPIKELGSTAVSSQTGTNMEIARPSHSTVNDLLLLFFSRTDDFLPIHLDGWTTGPVCFKTENEQEKCHTVTDCTKSDGDYCLEFGDSTRTGLDLATAVFYRTVAVDEPSKYILNPRCKNTDSCKPAWALLTALRGANNADPIGDSETISYDGVRQTVFPSVNGTAGDKLLLAMAFDDGSNTGVYEHKFRPPEGMRRLKYVIASDEAAFLYAEDLHSSGATGIRSTTGDGASEGKDAAISLIVKQANQSESLSRK